MASDFRFRSVWRIAAEPDAVQAVLADVAAYPQWWPSVVEGRVEQAATPGRGDGWIGMRGPLPYTLRVRLTQMDAPDGVLAARIRGDLLGWCSWHLSPAKDGGTCVVFQQHVILQRRSLQAIARVATRRLRANHDAVMRSGEAGLRALLER
ncbi:SRPBCC family protein [Agrococcus jejuensis]|uniref:Polyketide cyclase / dehydrase and lipid transport n=1 Tax=Agrococcus jejuensis TaxID=399736 RepID=A0A1G8CNX0_9MICO|nr:SRPBCC family protein [Agrococcus jejuensis]SDH46949.1 Polyketide cyclase / dehydrase and lipid transport [Agrococcus jejuensis]